MNDGVPLIQKYILLIKVIIGNFLIFTPSSVYKNTFQKR